MIIGDPQETQSNHSSRVLRDVAVRHRIVGILSLGYLGLVALVIWQALRGDAAGEGSRCPKSAELTTVS